MLSINGLKSSKSSESIKKNHSQEATIILKITTSTGMLMLKPIKKKPIINSALPDKLKHMIKSLNQPKYKDKSEHKCKNKAFLLIKEPTN